RLVSSDDNLIKDSEFNSNIRVGAMLSSGYLNRVREDTPDGAEEPPNDIRNVTIMSSEFNKNGLNQGPMGYGLLSSANVDGMEVTGSEFNDNYTAGMAFGPYQQEAVPQIQEAGIKAIEPPIEVKDISIRNSHFDNNGVENSTVELGEGVGLITYLDTSNLEVKNSTFDGNSTAGMSLGPMPPMEEDLPTASNISITGSSFVDNEYFGLCTNANIDGMDITRTEIKGNYFGILFWQGTESSSDISVNYSSINQSSENYPEDTELPIPNAGIVNTTDNTVNATINWWGAPDGPSADWKWEIDDEFNPEYSGGGDKILGSAAFAPWLGEDPDSNPDKPGVQLIDPLPIIVRKVGPVPTTKTGNTGYLDMAIWGASNVPVRGKVIVPHGNWQAKEPLGNNAELISEDGTTCHTCLEDVEESKLTVDGDEVTIGKLDDITPRGFIIKDEVKVQPGVDASTVHLNWNDIRSNVENDGDGRLDAEYNWWGDLDPSDSVTGDVDYRPFLPEDPCSFTDYMEEHNLEDPREAVVNRMSEGETCSTDLPKRMIVNYRLKPGEAEELVDEYGCYDIRKAMKEAGEDFGSFKDQLGLSKL
ncbi:MAG: right-handed parallel beta-helix repeat-containing protein, partial [Candidatus Bipolaricaulota bacterium]